MRADGSVIAQARVTALPPGVEDYMLLDCSQGMPSGSPRWYTMDDVIMGGVSSSALRFEPQEQAAVFSGLVTTDSNGGFASVRSEPWSGWTFAPSRGVRMMVKGDGRTYKLNAKVREWHVLW